VALALADAGGIEEVSLRNVANAFRTGPMRLYGYVSSKEELLELLVDEVYGQLVAQGPIKSPWRDALRTVAHRLRSAAGDHPWFTSLLSGRPHHGPNSLAFLESALAAITGPHGFQSIDDAVHALRVVLAFAIGAIVTEANELRAERASGMDEAQWQQAHWPYLQRMLESGRYPTIARVVHEAVHPSAEAAFEQGLACVLEGLAGRAQSSARAHAAGGRARSQRNRSSHR
jgi:AcrR family transcriptional regulator